MRTLLFIAFLALAVAPLTLAAAQGLPPRDVPSEIASALGMVATTILLVEFVLSGRFRRIMQPFGMDVTMRFHQLMARTALALALFHPILYTTWQRSADRPNDPSRQGFVSFDFEGLWPGIVAFLLLGAVTAMAIGRSDLGYRYEIWRFLHGAGAVLIALFGVLHATRQGRYSQDDLLWYFWWGLFAAAVVSLVVVYALKPAMQIFRPWRVASVDRTADRTWHVTLTPDGHEGLRYTAGQFAWVNFGHTPFSLSENPFSIASAPSAGKDLSFLIKELGDSTSRTGTLELGTRAYIDAPHGSLTIDGRGHPGIALIAGGVGLAPMLGILREMSATGDRRPSVLIYGNRHIGQIACTEDLDRFARDGTEIVHVLSEPPADWDGETGLIDARLITRHFESPERRDWLYVLCGPPAMLDTVEDALLSIGVTPRQILSEKFVYD